MKELIEARCLLDIAQHFAMFYGFIFRKQAEGKINPFTPEFETQVMANWREIEEVCEQCYTTYINTKQIYKLKRLAKELRFELKVCELKMNLRRVIKSINSLQK